MAAIASSALSCAAAAPKEAAPPQQPPHTIAYYVNNYFKVPNHMKNDIIYCQRALKAQLNIHQMVMEVFKQQGNADPMHKKRILDEIESEIYEINAEQQFLLLRLRRIIDEFNKMLSRQGLAPDYSVIHNVVSQEIVPAVTDPAVLIEPIAVQLRATEQQLIEKYFEYKADEVVDSTVKVVEDNLACYEVLDSDEEEQQLKKSSNAKEQRCEVKPLAMQRPKEPQHMGIKSEPNGFINQRQGKKLQGVSKDSKIAPPMRRKMKLLAQQQIMLQQQSIDRQMSLLKPMSERLGGSSVCKTDALMLLENEPFTDPSQFVEVTQDDSNQGEADFGAYNGDHQGGFGTKGAYKKTRANSLANELPVSKNVTMSRLNLRQALKKAQTENKAKAAAAAGSNVAAASFKHSLGRLSDSAAKSSNHHAPLPTTGKKAEPRTARSTRSAAASSAPAPTAVPSSKSPELNSSSEDSNPDQHFSSFPCKADNFPTKPEDIDQLGFLRFFNLYTKDVISQMQQRRSKRKRRNVHNNERSDFHYGRIEYGGFPLPEESKKKRKAFLLSPQVKRLQAKRGRPSNNADKLDAPSSSSRSSSSSPDDKRCCKECLKMGGYMESCDECKAFYHQSCHREEDFNMDDKNHKEIELLLTEIKLCPSCKIAQMKLMMKENQQYKALHELESKWAKLKTRRSILQHESKIYKIQMTNLFNIVNSIKIKREQDSLDKCSNGEMAN